jgi:hypothetical protein
MTTSGSTGSSLTFDSGNVQGNDEVETRSFDITHSTGF